MKDAKQLQQLFFYLGNAQNDSQTEGAYGTSAPHYMPNM
jgi:hypothetical protein